MSGQTITRKTRAISPRSADEYLSISSRYTWTNRVIQIRQCLSLEIVSGTESNQKRQYINELVNLSPPDINGQKVAEYLHENRIKINFISRRQVEYLLLAEIKKQEPYLEEEKRELSLDLIKNGSELDIDFNYYLKLDIHKPNNNTPGSNF
jgi:hypothetical protein